MSDSNGQFSTSRTTNTACQLDCPDACSLSVQVEHGRIVKIDGSTEQPVTNGYICAKVRNFGERVYGESRLLVPGIREGTKGRNKFRRASWDEALNLITKKIREVKDRIGGEAILPVSYGGSNGLISQDTSDARFFRGLGTSRLARTVCAAPTRAAATALYGRMPGVSYQDYVHAQLIVVWGANPSTSGIHLIPYIYDAQRQGAKLVVIDPHTTPLARRADLHLPVKPGTDIVVALAVHRVLFETGQTDENFLKTHTHGEKTLRERSSKWTIERAAEISGVEPKLLEQFAELYIKSSPAVIRCGWGIERNRNGGNAVMAVLALPSVAGKFGVRGGGYTMSNAAASNHAKRDLALDPSSWIDLEEPNTRIINMNQLGRALTECNDPPINLLFIYNCNPAATLPDQNRILKGLARDDLFTVVFEQVENDTTAFADVVLPATTFLESYDISRGYGAFSLQMVTPVIDTVGEARPNVEVFDELGSRLDLNDNKFGCDAEALLRVLKNASPKIRESLVETGIAEPSFGSTPVQFVDVFPCTINQKVELFPKSLESDTPAGLYRYQPDPATEQYPLTLISPASDRTINSTLGELHSKPAFLQINPTDALDRGIDDGNSVRVFNELGEVHCYIKITKEIRPGTVSLPKGLWRQHTLNGSTANALVPDSLTDLGGGACFNDARVQITLMMGAKLQDQPIELSVDTALVPEQSTLAPKTNGDI